MLPLRVRVDLAAMILHIPQSSKTGSSPSECLVSNPGYSLSEGGLTPLWRCSRPISQPLPMEPTSATTNTISTTSTTSASTAAANLTASATTDIVDTSANTSSMFNTTVKPQASRPTTWYSCLYFSYLVSRRRIQPRCLSAWKIKFIAWCLKRSKKWLSSGSRIFASDTPSDPIFWLGRMSDNYRC